MQDRATGPAKGGWLVYLLFFVTESFSPPPVPHTQAFATITRKPAAAPAEARKTVEVQSHANSKPSRGVADIVTTLQGYIQRLGKDNSRRLIDAL